MDTYAYKIARFRELSGVDRAELTAFVEANEWDEKFMKFVRLQAAIAGGIASGMKASTTHSDRVASPSEVNLALKERTV